MNDVLSDMTDSEKAERVAKLISFADLCARLQLTEPEVYWLMSIKQLPSWLVAGTWRFDGGEVDAWLKSQQGLGAVQSWVKGAIAQHAAAANK